MTRPLLERPRGILNPQVGATRFQLARLMPSPELGDLIHHYWFVQWDLRGQLSHLQETLPDPAIQLVFEEGTARIYGVMTRKFARRLDGVDGAFGIQFRIGGFRGLIDRPLWTLTDVALDVAEVFGAAGAAVIAAMHRLDLADHDGRIALAEAFLRDRVPAPDPGATVVDRAVTLIRGEPSLTHVDDVAARVELGARTLQRLFRRHVGVSPKWVLRRYRLLEAADRIAAGRVVDWPTLALDLGYCDQAHFIKDFRALVGRTPADYAAACLATDPVKGPPRSRRRAR